MQQRYPEQRDKLWITGFSPELPDHDLRQFCARFGTFVHLFRTKYKTDVFLKYMTEKDAELAMNKFNQDNITAKYAYDKSNGTSQQPDGNQRRVRFSNENGGRQSNENRDLVNGSSKQGVSQKTTVFRSGEEVIVTHVQADFYFYAHPKAKDQELNQLLEAISESATNAERLAGMPRKGDLVLACYNGNFRRALVKSNINSQNELVPISIIDFGFTAELPYHELKVLPETFSKTRITYRFQLDGCTEDTSNSYALECFKSFIGTTLRMECDEAIAKNLSKVKLFEPNTSVNINELVKQMMPGKCFTIDDQSKIPTPIGDNKELTVIDHTKLKEGYNLITFVEQSMNLKYYRQRNQTQNIAKIIETFPPYLPCEDELCFVKFNDFWYRGSFDKKASDTTAIVLVLDIEKGVEVELKNIRKITHDFAHEPHLLFSAALHGYGSKISKEQADGLMKKFKINDDVHVKSVSVDEENYNYSFKI